MNTYKLTLTFTLNAQDDPEARKYAKEIVNQVRVDQEYSEVKLQQIYTVKPPRGVKIT